MLHINSHKLMESSQGSWRIYASLIVKELKMWLSADSLLLSCLYNYCGTGDNISLNDDVIAYIIVVYIQLQHTMPWSGLLDLCLSNGVTVVYDNSYLSFSLIRSEAVLCNYNIMKMHLLFENSSHYIFSPLCSENISNKIHNNINYIVEYHQLQLPYHTLF